MKILKDFSLQNVKTVITSMKFRAYLTKIIRIAKLELITCYILTGDSSDIGSRG